MTMKLFILAGVLLLLAPFIHCQTLPDAPSAAVRQPVVDKPFIALMSTLAVAKTVDFAYTANNLGTACSAPTWNANTGGHRCAWTEADPLFGKHPSVGRMVAENTAIYAGTVLLSYEMKRSSNRIVHRLWCLPAVAQVAVHARYSYEWANAKH